MRRMDDAGKGGRVMKKLKPGDVIFEADPEHGVVEHMSYEIVTSYNTDARAEDGVSWSDQFTDDEIRTGQAFLSREDAAYALKIKRDDQSRA